MAKRSLSNQFYDKMSLMSIRDLVVKYLGTKKISFILLAATAIICARMLFFFFHDPEGPNLLIVAALALPLYLLSLAAYLFSPSKINDIKRLSAIIGIQIVLMIVLYFCMG